MEKEDEAAQAMATCFLANILLKPSIIAAFLQVVKSQFLTLGTTSSVPDVKDDLARFEWALQHIYSGALTDVEMVGQVGSIPVFEDTGTRTMTRVLLRFTSPSSTEGGDQLVIGDQFFSDRKRYGVDCSSAELAFRSMCARPERYWTTLTFGTMGGHFHGKGFRFLSTLGPLLWHPVQFITIHIGQLFASLLAQGKKSDDLLSRVAGEVSEMLKRYEMEELALLLRRRDWLQEFNAWSIRTQEETQTTYMRVAADSSNALPFEGRPARAEDIWDVL